MERIKPWLKELGKNTSVAEKSCANLITTLVPLSVVGIIFSAGMCLGVIGAVEVVNGEKDHKSCNY